MIVALDVEPRRAYEIAERLRGHAKWLKVGMTAFFADGPEVVRRLKEWDFEVFVDLKLHDIPHQVGGAAAVLGELGAGMLTVHAAGGAAMLEAAVAGAGMGARRAGVTPPAVIAVTVLTSFDAPTLASTGVADEPSAQVARLTRLVATAGVSGVVCSPHEAASARALLGASALVVTPGVRPSWASADDQARVATPIEAFDAGASHLVIGRPVTGADDPLAAFERIVAEAEAPRAWEGETD